jgi:hypothetical protein
MSDAPVCTMSVLKPRSGSPDLSGPQRRNRSVPTERDTPTPAAPETPIAAVESVAGEQVRDLATPSAPTTEQAAPPDGATVRAAAPRTESERTGRLSDDLSMDTLD